MRIYLPLLILGAIIGVFSIGFLIAFFSVKDKKEAFGFDRHMKDSYLVKKLMIYAKPYWRQFIFVIFLTIISVSYSIVSPLIVGWIEEQLVKDFQINTLIFTVIGYASILIVSLVAEYLEAVILQKTGQKILSKLREDLFSHIESLSHSQLNEIPVGKLVTRVTNDTNAISFMFTRVLVNLFKNMLIVVGIIVAMFCLNYMLTLVVLCFVPFIVLFTIIFRKFVRMAHRKVKDYTTDINTFLAENLSGIKIIQIFNREKFKMQQFDEKSNLLGKAKRNRVFVFAIFRPLVYLLYISSILCLFWVSSKGYIDNISFLGQTITSGVVVSFYMFITKFFEPIQNLAEQFNVLQSALASAEKVFTIFDIQPIIVDTEGAIDLENVKGDIEFKDVWFAYKEGEWILKGVSFKIDAKQTVAFVGSTGAGKTTILSLICRNFDIQKGQILIDGIDIKHIKISSLRKHFGQMLQDVFIFSGTIRSNIVLHNDYTDEEIMNACKYVNADYFISKLKNGLDEEVLERGNNFSAGQRQLLSFARTVIHKPEVMILDEATANIDTETEVIIQDSLEKMMNIGTMLIVAHRLSTVQHADKIIVLSHGEIIEEGSHNELLKKKGKYFELYSLQYEKERLLLEKQN